MRRRLGNALSDTFRSLEHRNFRLFFAGQFVSQVGNWLTLVALALLVLDRTGSGTDVGILTACQFGPILLLGAWAGLIADRADRRRLLLVVQVSAMAQSLALAGLAFLPAAPIGWFYVVAAVGGATMAFDLPVRRSYVVDLVPDELLYNAVSMNTAVMMSARVVGPALAGLLITTVGYGWCFLGDGLSYVAVLVGILLIDTSLVRPSPLATRGKGQVRAGLRHLREVPALGLTLVMVAVVGTLSFSFSVVFPLLVTRSLGGSAAEFTFLYAMASVGSVVGALLIARRASAGLGDVAVAGVAFGAALVLLAIVPDLGIALPVAVLVGGASTAFMSLSSSTVQLLADPVMRGRVVALQGMVAMGSSAVGGPILGAVCDAFGARTGVAVGAVAALGAGAWGISMARRLALTAADADLPVAAAADLVAAGPGVA
ncbi:MAG: arabinose efflux permease family protein [Actinomycetia bacterium]|nr:arabinose efflux permease family protein [Actinomycetes bacterium]